MAFMGTPAFSVEALDALHQAGHEIACVYTQPPRPAGRGKKPRPSPVQSRAEALGLEVRHPKSLRADSEQQAFADLKVEVAVVVAYGLILPQPILDAPKYGCLNIHASLLPRWRGAAPIQRAIMAGDAETGVCIMQMERGLDTGPVLLRRSLSISPTDTAGDLHDRLATLGAAAIVEAVSVLPTLTATTQADDGVTYAEKIDKSEARIDWSDPADKVARQIQSLSPFPGAWCLAGNERLKLLRASVIAGVGEPGENLGNFVIACGSKAIKVSEAQREGKRAASADDLLRGLVLPSRLD